MHLKEDAVGGFQHYELRQVRRRYASVEEEPWVCKARLKYSFVGKKKLAYLGWIISETNKKAAYKTHGRQRELVGSCIS